MTYSTKDKLHYFTQPSNNSNPGGMNGHTEVLASPTAPNNGRWNTDTKMVALCLCPTMANRIANLLGNEK